jgi:hypothetical protein
MESAIIEALWRRFRPKRPHARVAPIGGAGDSAPQTSADSGLRGSVRRAARLTVGGLCWLLGLVLYAVPVRPLGAGDAMLVVAQKRQS